MTRVLRIIARLNVGGPAIHVALASSGLDATGKYATRLLAGELGTGEGDMEWFARERGVAVEKVPGLGRELSAGGDLRAISHVLGACRSFRPHVIHTHTAKAGAVGRVAGSIYNATRKGDAPRAKLVHTFHGHVLRGYFGRVKQGFFRSVERTLARRTDRLVVPSPRLMDDLLALGVGRREQYGVVPLGFELAPFLAVAPRPKSAPAGPLRQELGIPADAFTVGIVGRLTAIKNQAMFLRAAARLQRRTRAPMRFVLVGDGELREELEAQARAAALGEVVHFAGWRKDLAPIYAELDAVALTSRNEGTPVTLIEAMAACRPVVSTAVGGVADIVEDGVSGILVDAGRDDMFAVAMGRLADEPDLRSRLAAAGRERAARRFTADRLIHDLDALYGGLL